MNYITTTSTSTDYTFKSIATTGTDITIGSDLTYMQINETQAPSNQIRFTKECAETVPALQSINAFVDVIEYVPNKVYEFYFMDGSRVKTICDDSDVFDLEFAFYLALAKKLYSKTHTLEGVYNKALELSTIKDYVKIVKHGMKILKIRQDFEKEAGRLKQEIKERHQRIIEKKIKKKQRHEARKQEQLYETIKKAIQATKE